MRKSTASLAALALICTAIPLGTGSMALAAPSGPGINAETLAACHDLMQSNPDLKLGVCMGFQLSQNTYGFVPHICAYLEDFGLLDYYGFDSYADCVRNAR